MLPNIFSIIIAVSFPCKQNCIAVYMHHIRRITVLTCK